MEDFWSHGSGEKEVAQCGNLADAAKAAGVRHAVFSTLDDSRRHIPPDGRRMPLLQGRFNVPHYDAKGEACAHFRDIGLPTTFLITSIFYESFTGQGPVAPIAPQRVPGAANKLRISFPMGAARMPALAVGDIGRATLAILKAGPEAYAGKEVGLAGDRLTGADMAAAFTRVLGVTTEYVSPTFDDFRAAGFPGAMELGNQFQFWHDAEARACVRACVRVRGSGCVCWREVHDRLMRCDNCVCARFDAPRCAAAGALLRHPRPGGGAQAGAGAADLRGVAHREQAPLPAPAQQQRWRR